MISFTTLVFAIAALLGALDDLNYPPALRFRQRTAFRNPHQVALGTAVVFIVRMHLGGPPHVLAVQRVLHLPLYPQYSATTTASIFDEVTAQLRNWRWLPEMRFINQYHDAPGYIEALAASVHEFWEEHGRGSHLLLSFHGVPRYTLEGAEPLGWR